MLEADGGGACSVRPDLGRAVRARILQRGGIGRRRQRGLGAACTDRPPATVCASPAAPTDLSAEPLPCMVPTALEQRHMSSLTYGDGCALGPIRTRDTRSRSRRGAGMKPRKVAETLLHRPWSGGDFLDTQGWKLWDDRGSTHRSCRSGRRGGCWMRARTRRRRGERSLASVNSRWSATGNHQR